MNVLFLMISYPNIEINTNMYTDLVQEFYNNKHNVYVVAPSLNNMKGISKEGNINVLRVKTGKLFNVNPIIKGISNLLLPYLFSKAINKHLKNVKFDLIITPTPPITFCSTIKSIKKRDKCKSYLILRDIFPQNAKDLGLIKNKYLFSYFRNKEKQIYKISDKIGCMSQGNIDYVLKHNIDVPKNKLHILSNWIKIDNFKISDIDYKAKFGFKGKFICIYGGNIGKPQKAEFILELAERVKEYNDILFLIIGRGTEKEKLVQIAKMKNLNNVIFKSTLPREDYKQLVKQCDIGLVNLSDKFTIPNIPSRTLSYFEAKLPILASTDNNTDFVSIINNTKSGLCCMTGDVNDYVDKFMSLYNNRNKRIEMGDNGYKYLKEYLNVDFAYKTIIENV